VPGDTLPPVVAKLVADTSEFLEKLKEAEAVARSTFGGMEQSTHSSTASMEGDLDHLADVWVDDTGRARDAQGNLVRLSEQDWTELGRRAEDSSSDVRSSMQRVSSGADDLGRDLDRMAGDAKGPLESISRGFDDVASSVKRAAEDIVPSEDSIGGGATNASKQTSGFFSTLVETFSSATGEIQVAAAVILGPGALGGILALLDLVAGAAMALPGALGALVAVAATVKLAFNGMSTAIQDGWKDANSDQFKKDMKGLTGQAQDFVTSIIGLKPALADMQRTVQNLFFSGLDTKISALSGLFSGPLKTGLDAVATGVNTVAKHFLDWLANPDVGPGNTLQQFLKNVGDIVTSLSPGVTRFADAILKLANDASPFFDTVAGVFDQISTDLDNWVSGNGVSTIGTDFKTLGDTLKGVVPLIEQLGKFFAQALGDPTTQKAIKDMFKTLSDMITYLGPSIPFLILAFDEWMKALDKLAPVIGGIVLGLGILSAGIAEIILVVAWCVKAFVGYFQWLYDILVGHSIIPDLVNAITKWFGKLAAIPEWFLGWFKKAASAVSNGANSIVSVVKGIPGRISGALGNLGGLLYNRGMQIVQGLVNGIQSAAGWLMSVAEGLASKVESAFSKVLKYGSPSKVFIERGQQIVQGLVLGITGQQYNATRAAAGLAGMTAAGFGTPTLAATAASIGAAAAPGLAFGGAGGGPADQQVVLMLDKEVLGQAVVRWAQRHKGRNVTTMFT
jgi:phage-related protein